MKKAFLIVALLTLSLAFTFAQASVGGWGRGIFVPVAMADGDPTAASLVSWGPGGTRMGFTISGTSDNIGVKMDILVDLTSVIAYGSEFDADPDPVGEDWSWAPGGTANVVTIGDNQFIWAKPIEMLTLKVGRAWEDALRGNASFVAYNWLRYDYMEGDGLIFGRVGEYGPANFMAVLTPVDGATIFAAFGGNGQMDLQNVWGGPLLVETMIKTGQYGAGYDIPGIGLIRAQLYGMNPTISDDWFMIQAAFKLTMIENLIVDIGATFPTVSDEADGMVAKAALYGNYVMDTLTLHLEADMTMYDEDVKGEDDTLAFGVGLGVEYGLEGGLTIQGDVRYRNNVACGRNALGDYNWEDGEFGVGAFAKFSYSNGIFGVGAQMTNGNFANWGAPLIDKTDPTAMVFAIPVRLEYWF